jgi:MFS transporter, DHA1 family, staphyloferrin A biosynthesis exporter
MARAGSERMNTEVPRRVRLFSALANRDFRVFWTGFLVSMTGNWMQLFALGWLVVELAVRAGTPERAPLYLGLVGFARLIPSLAVSLVAGAVADRVDRRTVLIVEESCALVIALVLAVLTVTDAITIGWVIGLSAAGAVTGTFENLTRSAIVPGLLEPERLVSGVTMNSAAVNLAVLLGPLLGGVLIGTLGIGGLLFLNAATFLASLLSLALIPAQRIDQEPGRREGMAGAIRTGLAYVRETPFVRWQLFLLAAVTLLGSPLSQLLPAWVNDRHMGAVELSWLLAAEGAGGLLATLVAPLLGSRRGYGLVFVATSLGAGVTMIFFGMQRRALTAFALIVLVGLLMVVAHTLCMMIAQLTTPDHLRGRVISVQALIVNAGIPAGTLVLGAWGSVVGVGAAVSAAGVLLTVASLVVLLRAPTLRAI